MKKCIKCNHDLNYHIRSWPVFRDGKRICEACEIRKIIKKAELVGGIDRKDFVEPYILKRLWP